MSDKLKQGDLIILHDPFSTYSCDDEYCDCITAGIGFNCPVCEKEQMMNEHNIFGPMYGSHCSFAYDKIEVKCPGCNSEFKYRKVWQTEEYGEKAGKLSEEQENLSESYHGSFIWEITTLGKPVELEIF